MSSGRSLVTDSTAGRKPSSSRTSDSVAVTLREFRGQVEYSVICSTVAVVVAVVVVDVAIAVVDGIFAAKRSTG